MLTIKVKETKLTDGSEVFDVVMVQTFPGFRPQEITLTCKDLDQAMDAARAFKTAANMTLEDTRRFHGVRTA